MATSAILYIDPNCDCNFEDIQNPETLKKLLKTSESVHSYRTIDDFIEAFNNGYISDEGYLVNPQRINQEK